METKECHEKSRPMVYPPDDPPGAGGGQIGLSAKGATFVAID